MENFIIKFATIDDIPLILSFIKELAEYEKIADQVKATPKILTETLFGAQPAAEVLLGYYKNTPVAFAVFFHNFSTFLGRPGIHLEDLYVKPAMRGRGFGKKIIQYLARLAKKRQCGRLEWCVLDWNKPAINFYKNIGAQAMDEWTTYRITGKQLDELAAE